MLGTIIVDENNGSAVFRIRDIYEVVPSSGGLPHVRSGEEIILKVAGEKGVLLGRLLEAIDGKKNAEQLANEFEGETDRETIGSAINFLLTKGIIEEAVCSESSLPVHLQEQIKYFSHYVAEPEAAIKTLAATKCLIVGEQSFIERLSGDMVLHGFVCINGHAVNSGDVGSEDDGFDEIRAKVQLADFVVLVNRNFSSDFCCEINHLCLEHCKPVLFADLSSGGHGVVGPLCVGGQCSCYMCYESRLFANSRTHQERLDYEALKKTRSSSSGSFGSLMALGQIVGSLVIVEVVSYLVKYRAPRTIDGTLIVDLFQTEIYREPVLKMPGCRACGSI